MSNYIGTNDKKFWFGISLSFFLLTTTLVNANGLEWTAERTEHEQPDLQGIWYFGSNTPFERPTDLGEKQAYTTEEALAIEKEMLEANKALDAPLDPERNAPEVGGRIGFKADYNFATHRNSLNRVNGEYRTSLVVDPADGRIPIREGFSDFTARRRAMGINDFDGPESADGRCLGGRAVDSLYPMPWNANLQIVQTSSYVMIMTEMIHNARIIRLDGSHRSDGIEYWSGDSVAHWEGDTLVVHTNSFRVEQTAAFMHMPLSEDFELTERFTATSKNEILYQFTVVDPQAYTRPFTVERIIQRRAPGEHIYEFACHEGNYSMIGSLAGTRLKDRSTSEQGN